MSHYTWKSDNKNSAAAYIRLGNKETWNIVPTTKPGIQIVSELQHIMNLDIAGPEGCRKLLLYASDTPCYYGQDIIKACKSTEKTLPTRKWQRTTLPCSANIYTHPDTRHMICDVGYTVKYEYNAMLLGRALPVLFLDCLSDSLLPFHAAMLEKDGTTILLGAQSGAGKTTCTRRIPKGWHVLCDDLTVIVKNGHESYTVHPFPTWSDYIDKKTELTWNVQKNSSLSAIFFLEQSEIDEILPIRQGEAALRMVQLSTQILGLLYEEYGRERKTRIFDNAWDIASSVPTYILRASLTGEFWKEIEKVIRCDGKNYFK